MTRKKFLSDFNQLRANPPANVTDVERYDGDGVSFTYTYSKKSVEHTVKLKLIAANVDEYPDGNQFIFFTDDNDVDPIITDVLEQIQATIDGSSVSSAFQKIIQDIPDALSRGSAGNPVSIDSGNEHESVSDQDSVLGDQDVSYYDDDDASFGLADILPKKIAPIATRSLTTAGFGYVKATRADLNAARNAGFKIGVHGDPSTAGIVCISVRIAKLGISDEAIRAWDLARTDYFVLLIRFMHGYKSLAHVQEEAILNGAVELRVGLCDYYKPGLEEAFAAFNAGVDQSSSQPTSQLTLLNSKSTTKKFKSLFIGRPLNDLLRDRFPKIVKFRDQFDLSWQAAERLFNDRQGALVSDASFDILPYLNLDDNVSPRALPRIVLDDELGECKTTDASLPLVAMQFALRHFVRCTEFCLVCHCKVEDTFEALKPYVCSNPLCLYQFLALGFGPAAEWEILSQPSVVDLLVSLCYAQTQAKRLKEFPVGMNLKVPLLPHYKDLIAFNSHVHYRSFPVPSNVSSTKLPASVRDFEAKFQCETETLTPVGHAWSFETQRPKKGEWIVCVSKLDHRSLRYGRIAEDLGNAFSLKSMIYPKRTDGDGPPMSATLSTRDIEFDCYSYRYNLDDLPDAYRHVAITSLLDTLPSVEVMSKILAQNQIAHRDVNLNVLRKICPQSALDLLRWIIASNRSCIMQVDEVVTGGNHSRISRTSEDRVSGMDHWMQFRFAQGAPDKEQRFVDCVKSKSSSVEYPTLFAWHGSPMHNWHSIIRQGLNFDEIAHGRATGNGVYMSPFLTTSMSYSQGLGGFTSPKNMNWPNSSLNIVNVVSLQEVVNAPSSFVSQSPHFVVAQKDWIQTRYLFVKTSVKHSHKSSAKLLYEQDPMYVVKGSNNESISIPITAISKSRRPKELTSSILGKEEKKKKRKVDEEKGVDQWDDGISVATDEEDRNLFAWSDGRFSENDSDDLTMIDINEGMASSRTNAVPSTSSPKGSKKRGRENLILDPAKTDFIPGTLDVTDIRFLAPPDDASTVATKALMKAFKETIEVQASTPLHELGFYIDPDRMENMYQWIVEMHSFDPTLPLAADMKSAGISSVVFEVRFTNEFPFSPPFVRVVKPRFLDPMSGGGGHITSGGAICMELLTSTGWSVANTIESVLFQVRLAMSERERPARLLRVRGGRFETSPYPIGEAVAAYKRFCQKHGWREPDGLDRLQSA